MPRGGYASEGHYLENILSVLKGLNLTMDVPTERRTVLNKYKIEKTKSIVYTVVDTVPVGEQWVIQAANCWTDKLVRSVQFGVSDKGGHVTVLARAENVEGEAIRWTGEVIAQEKESVVMIVENRTGSSLARAHMTYRGYYE